MSKLYVTTVCVALASQNILSGKFYIIANIIHRFMTKIRKWGEKCRESDSLGRGEQKFTTECRYTIMHIK